MKALFAVFVVSAVVFFGSVVFRGASGRNVLEVAVRPVFQLAGIVRSRFSSLYHGMFFGYALQKQVEELEKSLAFVSVDRAELENTKHENEELRKQFAQMPEIARRLAPVRAAWGDTVIVFAGRRDGVQEGTMVVWNGVYLGVVDRVSERTAEVDTVWSLRKKLRVVASRGGASGVLVGDRGVHRIEHIPSSVYVQEGDVWVTAGDDRGILPGIPVAVVRSIVSLPSDPEQILDVIPLASQNVENVFVYTGGGK